MELTNRPGGTILKRKLHFFFVLDRSTSMGAEGKIQALNTAGRETIPEMRDVAKEHPEADILVRSLSFGQDLRWDVATPTPINDFNWTDLMAWGGTPMGAAMWELANAMSTLNMPERGLTPVVVLVSDGQPTDDFLAGLANLEATPWGKKAIRLAVGIGRDADFEVLRRFVNQPTCPPFHAHNAPMLSRQITFASTAALKCASAPHSQTRSQNLPGNCAPISVPANLQQTSVGVGDVW